MTPFPYTPFPYTFPPDLRDYFAAAALPAALDNFEGGLDYVARAAALAYRIADAMVLERAKGGAP